MVNFFLVRLIFRGTLDIREKDTRVHKNHGKGHFCLAPKKKVTYVSKKTVLSCRISMFLTCDLECKKDTSVHKMTKFYFFLIQLKAIIGSDGNCGQTEI